MSTEWIDILHEVRKQVPQKYYIPFIEPLILINNDELQYTLKAPSNTIKNHVEKKYLQQIQNAIENITGKKFELNIFVDSNINPIENFLQLKHDDSEFQFNPSYTFENFCIGESNAQAVFSSKEIISNPNSCNPVYIFGKVGVGKTHLLHAIANEMHILNREKKIKYLSMADFLSEYVFSVQTRQGIEAFRIKYQSYQTILVDDIQTLNSSAEKTQEEFLLLFNFLFDRKRQIIIAADKPISELPLNEKLRSRLNQGYQTEIRTPDESLSFSIIERKAKELQLFLSNDSISYIAKNFSDDTRAIIGCLNDLYLYKKAYSLLILDPEKVCQILESRLTRIKDFKPSEEKVLDFIAEKYSQPKKDILSKSRKAEFIMPRHISMYILHEICRLNKTVIGRMFSTNHTTVISAIQRIQKLMNNDAIFKREITLIQNQFGLK